MVVDEGQHNELEQANTEPNQNYNNQSENSELSYEEIKQQVSENNYNQNNPQFLFNKLLNDFKTHKYFYGICAIAVFCFVLFFTLLPNKTSQNNTHISPITENYDGNSFSADEIYQNPPDTTPDTTLSLTDYRVRTIGLRVTDDDGSILIGTFSLNIGNCAPFFSNPSVSSTGIYSGSDYTYEVDYFDPDNDVPSYVKLILESTPPVELDMVKDPADDTYADGCTFSITTTGLPKGVYT